MQRAVSTKFNPYLQVQTRLKSLQKTGHPIDKIELRIIGGTWSYYPKQYQRWFVKKCFQACNQFFKSSAIASRLKNLRELQRRNEKVKCRIIGFSKPKVFPVNVRLSCPECEGENIQLDKPEQYMALRNFLFLRREILSCGLLFFSEMYG